MDHGVRSKLPIDGALRAGDPESSHDSAILKHRGGVCINHVFAPVMLSALSSATCRVAEIVRVLGRSVNLGNDARFARILGILQLPMPSVPPSDGFHGRDKLQYPVCHPLDSTAICLIEAKRGTVWWVSVQRTPMLSPHLAATASSAQ